MTTIVFLGAGSVVFTRELLTDLLGFPEFADARIVLHDIDPERLATASALAGRIADAYGARPSVVATLDRRAALDGADFVINAIQVGMYPATRVDFEVPARFGLRQTIGDTIGIGGIFRSAEYVPWYLRHDSEIDRLRIPVGDYLRVSEDNLASYATTRAAPGPIDLNRDTTEYAPQVIHSMVTGTPRVGLREWN